MSSSPSSIPVVRPRASRRVVRTLVALACVALLPCACTTTADDLPPEMRAVSVVSSRGPGAPLARSGRFVWGSGSRVIADPETYDAAAIEDIIRTELLCNMEDLGWSMVGSAAVGVEVRYVVATDRDLDDAALQREFGMSPGLPSAGSAHGKGTLVVELRRPGAPQALWRGAAQILADPDLPADVRRERIRRGIDSLMSRVPLEG